MWAAVKCRGVGRPGHFLSVSGVAFLLAGAFLQAGFFLLAGVFCIGSLLFLQGAGDGVFLLEVFFPGVSGSSLAAVDGDVPAGWSSSCSTWMDGSPSASSIHLVFIYQSFQILLNLGDVLKCS